jgi:hypothetical protein
MTQFIVAFALLIALVLGASPAQAEPITIALFSTIGVSLAAGTFTTAAITFALGTAVSLGLSYLGRALLTPKPQAGDALTGLETQVQIGGDIPRQIAVGHVSVKGQLAYHNTNGPNNELYQRVFLLSDSVVHSLTKVSINGVEHDLILGDTDAYHDVYTTAAHTSNFVMILWKGNQTAADSLLVANANPAGKWDPNSILTGIAYVACYFTYVKDSPLYENGIPDLSFHLKGSLLYDWRKDTTAGGSGSHRWDDKATWEYTENPIVVLYNFRRGFYANGELILGMGVPANTMLLDIYTAAANSCDENVTLSDAGTEKRYRISTIFTADQNVTWGQSIDVILSTCAGYLHDYSGFDYPVVGVAQASVATITDNDLRIGSPITFAKKRTRDNLVNAVHGQFLDATSNFEPKSYEARISSVGTAEDGEERGVALDLLSVPSQFQAERIAEIRLREARAQATAQISLGYEWIRLQAGDWITWNSALYGNRTYRIVSRSRDAVNRFISLELAEINSAVFSWGSSDEGVIAPPAVRLVPGGQASTVSGFGLTTLTVLSGDGITQVPAIKAFWDPVTDPTVDAVYIQYRPVGATTATPHTDATPGDGETLIMGVVGSLNYEARATIITTPTRVTTWTPWVRQVTAAAVFGTFTEVVGSLSDQLNYELSLITDAADDTSLPAVRARIEDIIERLANTNAEASATAFGQRDEERTEIARVSDAQVELSASVVEERNARIDGDEASAQLVTDVRSDITDAFGVTSFAEVTTKIGTFVSATDALAIAEDHLTAKIDDGTIFAVADITTRMAAYAATAEAATIFENNFSSVVSDAGYTGSADFFSTISTHVTSTEAHTAATEEITAKIDDGTLFAVADISTRLAAYATETEAGAIAETHISSALSPTGGPGGTPGAIRADVDSVAATRTTPSQATALAQTEVTALLDDYLASGSIRFLSIASPTGVEARFAVQVKAAGPGTFHTAGLYIDVINTAGVYTSHAVLDADLIKLGTADSAGTYPFVLIGSALYLQDVVVLGSLIEPNSLHSGGNKSAADTVGLASLGTTGGVLSGWSDLPANVGGVMEVTVVIPADQTLSFVNVNWSNVIHTVNSTSGASGVVTLETALFLDGAATPIAGTSITSVMPVATGGGRLFQTVFSPGAQLEVLGPGSHSIKARWRYSSTSVQGQPGISAGSLVAFAPKR